jgi:hypothetical protein
VTRVPALAALLFATACSHSSQEVGPAPSPSGNASASSAPVASAPAAASAATASSAPQSWRGKYSTTPTSLVVPKDWSKTHWSSSDTTAGVGDGAITLTIDPATHRVTGTLDGAIGAAVVEGQLGTDGLTASVRRKDPTDKGLSGTLVATMAADKITGALTLTTGDGATLRAGTFSLAPDGH